MSAPRAGQSPTDLNQPPDESAERLISPEAHRLRMARLEAAVDRCINVAQQKKAC